MACSLSMTLNHVAAWISKTTQVRNSPKGIKKKKQANWADPWTMVEKVVLKSNPI